MWYFAKLVTVSTFIDVFPWDLDTMILGLSHTPDLNGLGVKGHLGVNDLWFKFLQKRVTVSTYIDIFSWDLDKMILGGVTHVTSTEVGSKVILGSLTFWLSFKKLSLYYHGSWTNIAMIVKVCDRESRRDWWFENRLVMYLFVKIIHGCFMKNDLE